MRVELIDRGKERNSWNQWLTERKIFLICWNRVTPIMKMFCKNIIKRDVAHNNMRRRRETELKYFALAVRKKWQSKTSQKCFL
jgi:hypothetical protein